MYVYKYKQYMDGTMGYKNLRWFPGFPGSPIPIVGEGSLPHHLHITTLCGEMPGGPKKTYPINTSTSNNYCNKEMKEKRIRFYKHKLLVIFFGKSKLNQKDILKNYLQKYIQLTVLTWTEPKKGNNSYVA